MLKHIFCLKQNGYVKIKFYEYKSIVNYKMKYLLEDNLEIEFKLKQTDFPHLIGLHKLIDIPLIRKFNDKNNKTVSAKYIIAKIKKQSILTGELVRNSCYFKDIQNRYDQFNKDNLLTVSYTDAVVNFDASLIGSKLSSDYILFERSFKRASGLLQTKHSPLKCLDKKQNREKIQYRKWTIGAAKMRLSIFCVRDYLSIFYIGFFHGSSVLI